jgi:hypothetical protein
MAREGRMSPEERKKLEREITSKLPTLTDEQLKKMAGGLGGGTAGGYGRGSRFDRGAGEDRGDLPPINTDG